MRGAAGSSGVDSEGYRVARVTFEAHGKPTNYTLAEVLGWEDTTHPIAYSAMNSHAMHNMDPNVSDHHFDVDIPGRAEARPWTNREAVGARSVPRRLAILGGGVVACEMATLWKQLGTDEITIIQRGARLIPNYEPFASDLLKSAFEQKGMSVLTETTAGLAERKPDGAVIEGPANVHRHSGR